MVEKAKKKQPAKSVVKESKNLELHELTIRVENLESSIRNVESSLAEVLETLPKTVTRPLLPRFVTLDLANLPPKFLTASSPNLIRAASGPYL